MSRLWLFYSKPGPCLFHGPLDAQQSRVEVNVAPAKRANLAAAEPRPDCNGYDRQKSMTGHFRENLADLVGCEDDDFVRVDLGRPDHGGDVPPDHLKLPRPRERRMKNSMGMTSGAR